MFPLIARYQELQSLGLLQLRQQGLSEELGSVGTSLVDLLQSGREDLFIQTDGGRGVFQDIPAAFQFPATLALRGRVATLARIDLPQRGARTYIRIDQILSSEETVRDDEVDDALHRLNTNLREPPRVIGTLSHGSQVLLEVGAAWFLAAQERGDTHLLVSLRPRSPMQATAGSIDRYSPPQSASRSEARRHLLQRYEEAKALSLIRESSSHPQLLTALALLVDLDHQPNPARFLLFLEQLCRNGFCRNGRPMDPSAVPVAIVGFGDETDTIQAFLQLGACRRNSHLA